MEYSQKMSFVSFLTAFFLAGGRITRMEWLTRVAVAALFCAAFGSLAAAVIGDTGSNLFSLLFIWSAIALAAQRLHDVGRAGSSLLVAVVPVVGPIWVLVQLLRRGVDHPNRYGADPASRSDYLTVNIAE
jgi:uncharacterized membrane protein YhaH (DUF805 family)